VGLEQLDVVGGQPHLHNGSRVDGSINPVEKTLLRHHHRPHLPEILHEVAQGLHDVQWAQ